MAVYPVTYQMWRDVGYTGYEADYEKWKLRLQQTAAYVAELLPAYAPWRLGVASVTLLTTTQTVTFAKADGTPYPIDTDDYSVFFSLEGVPIALNISSDQHVKAGFRLRATLSVATTIRYIAFPNQL